MTYSLIFDICIVITKKARIYIAPRYLRVLGLLKFSRSEQNVFILCLKLRHPT